MAVRHIKQYYETVANQYTEMLNTFQEFEKECQQGLVEPERLENIKKTILPLKNNYEQISYIMYLLNQPNRDSKVPAYKRRMQKALDKIDKSNTTKAKIEKNEQVLEELKK